MKKFPLLTLVIVMLIVMTACTLPTGEIGDLLATLLPHDSSTPVVCPTCEPCEICETPVVITEEPTATEAIVITETPTNEPTATLEPTEMPTPTSTPEPTATDLPMVYPYIIQPGSPVYIDNVFHPEDGENWMGIGGQVFNALGEPQPLIVVHVDGVLEGNEVELVSMTGVARYLGPEGYEVELADHGIDSEGTLTITLFDLAGNQISEAYAFDTFSALSKAQIIINFIQNNE